MEVSRIFVVLMCLSQALGYSFYEVTIRTSSDYMSGVDRKTAVHFRIYGKNGFTVGKNLNQNGDKFKQGRLDKFHIMDGTDVGPVTKVALSIHPRPANFDMWKIDYVKVKFKGIESTMNIRKWIRDTIYHYYKVTSCSSGYGLVTHWHLTMCQDKNECSFPNICVHGKCTNTVGSYKCSCNNGYEKKGSNCVDKNECDSGHKCQHNCVNTDGSYKCTCNKGYRVRDRIHCENINECRENNPCIAPATCVDSVGSYLCECPSGFTKTGNHNCQDIDECSSGRHQCAKGTSTCVNLPGDYRCQCKLHHHQGNNNKECIEDAKCPPLLINPNEGKIQPQTCQQPEANYPGSQCLYSCNSGYELEDPTANTLSCGQQAKWTGKTPKCGRVKCPALSPIDNGSLSPNTCTTTGGTYMSTCSYVCDSGYQIFGVGQRQCQSDKSWDGAKPACTKVVPKPWISCPFDIMVDLLPGENTANVSKLWRTPKSNMKHMMVSPATATADFPYPSGETKITWSVKNAAGSDSCSFLVIVNDKEKPSVAFCPSSPIRASTKTLSAVAVTWKEPKFTDNVAVVKVTHTHSPGDMFTEGTVQVHYRAFDKEKNSVECSFSVVVKREGCPDLEGPFKGNKSCSTFSHIFFCTIRCPVGTVVYNNPAPYGFWSCNKGAWTPTDRVPDCVAATEIPDGSPKKCPDDKVVMTIVNNIGRKTYCTECPTGTFRSNGACVTCPAGQYQDTQNSVTCKPCPSGTSSHQGASKAGHCRVVCGKGKYSFDGLEPSCNLCPADTYQDQTQSTSCKKCPQGTKTHSVGSSSPADCGTKPQITNVVHNSQTINEGETVSISCYATGKPRPTIDWKFGKTIDPGFLGHMTKTMLTNADNNVIGLKLTITKATYENNGKYVCSAENSWGKAMAVSTLNVNKIVVGSGMGSE